MKLTHPAVVAFGIAMLLTLPAVAPLIEPSHATVYHLDGATSLVFYSVFISIGLLWILFTGLLTLARRPGRTRIILWTAVIAMLPWVVLKVISAVEDWPMPHRISLLLFIAGPGAVVVVPLLWKPAFQPFFDHAQEFVATLLAFFAVSGLIILGQLCVYAWQTRSMNAPEPLHHSSLVVDSAQHPTSHPRIIWLILDELSYRQLYEHRFPSLQLPAFDRLAAQSIVFTHVVPAGLKTEFVIPSLISGLPADAMRASSDGRQLSLRDPFNHGWQHFDPHQTVFQDALDRGYSTAISGWYNPYCRLMSQVLDDCFWTYHGRARGGISTHQTIFANIATLLSDPVGRAHHFISWHKQDATTDEAEAQAHIDDYGDIFSSSDAMLSDSSVGLLLLHLPVPHPFGIYNRHTHQFTTGPSTYIDNLALADSYLDHLRSQLEQRGQWDSSTILIMGDHSWRTSPLWIWNPAWTYEEQAASDGGRFDDRPGYILKLPNQHQPAHIDASYPAIRTRALIDALMDQRIQSTQDLEDWVANPSSPAADSVAQ